MSIRSFFVLATVLSIAIAVAIPQVRAETNYTNELYLREFAEIHRRLDAMERFPAVHEVQTKDYGPAFGILETEGCPAWMFGLDYLHWAVRNPNTQYGITDIGGVQDRGAFGEVLDISAKYDPGFRFVAGRRLGNHGSSTEFVFRMANFDQRLNDRRIGPLRASFISSDNSENNDSDDGVNDITPDDRATSATAFYDFSYNAYDLELAQNIITTETLNVRLAGIGRAIDMEQEFNVTYTGGDFQVPYRAFETSDYVGGGVLLGGDLVWQLRDALRLSFGLKAGALVGTYNTQSFFPDDEPGVPTSVTQSYRRMSTVIESNLGLSYRRAFGRFLFDGTLGYEMTQLMDMSDQRVFSDSHMEGQNSHLIGNIGLDGMYARMALEF